VVRSNCHMDDRDGRPVEKPAPREGARPLRWRWLRSRYAYGAAYVLAVGILVFVWTVVAAPPSVDSLASYASAQEIADVMDTSGFACNSGWMTAQPNVEAGSISQVDCDWRNPVDDPSLKDDRVNIIVFASQQQRLTTQVKAFAYGCGVLDPPPTELAYTYGADWVVISGWGANDQEAMQELASKLNGAANATGCSNLYPYLTGTEDTQELESMATDDLRKVLGER
jgi:hypothetical protein